MWSAVTARFKNFHNEILLTAGQIANGSSYREGVVGSLNRSYYNSSDGTDHSFFIGSWGKNTAIRPPRDVDIYFVLPDAVYHRFQNYQTGRQSALLQEVKQELAITYPDTQMRGDGQVVVVGFGAYAVEVVPAFQTTESTTYLICDTNSGGSYKLTRPWHQVVHIDQVDESCAANLRPLIRMLKTWQMECSVPLKSFALELLAANFLSQCEWRLNSWFYFDWITRDFFAYLLQQANKSLIVPGSNEIMWLGDAWKTRAETALIRARRACDHEHADRIVEAGQDWQMIFGFDIPQNP